MHAYYIIKHTLKQERSPKCVDNLYMSNYKYSYKCDMSDMSELIQGHANIRQSTRACTCDIQPLHNHPLHQLQLQAKCNNVVQLMRVCMCVYIV